MYCVRMYMYIYTLYMYTPYVLSLCIANKRTFNVHTCLLLVLSCTSLPRIPDCIANVGSLTHLYLNDVALPALPREIGK